MLPRTRLANTSLRTRVLTMALVPSVALLLAGVIAAGFLTYSAIQVRSVLIATNEATPEGRAFFTAVRQERAITLRALSRPQINQAALRKARANLDEAANELFTELTNKLADDAPQSVVASINRELANLARLDEIRQRVDKGKISLVEAYRYYNELMDEFAYGLTALAKGFDDPEITYLKLKAMPLFLAADGMARAHAFAAAALASGGMTDKQFRIFATTIGAYHERLESSEPSMTPPVRSRYEQLLKSQAWQRLMKIEHAILAGEPVPVSPKQWHATVAKVGKILSGLYINQSDHATKLALERSKETLIWTIAGSIAVIAFAVIIFVVALRSSNRLVRRLTSLRGQTLSIAERRLPELVEDVRSGKQVATDSEDLRIDQGEDEIGQVGDAFNKAQQTAISAAVEEAKIRQGTRTVFLNIAHRSQVIVHRQLKALDQAERKQDDPDQLDLLFQLDHLSTRARRNAENLIILGGQQPGRQWRNPVAVADLVRGAIAETEDYARVSVGKLPDVAVQGGAVGDAVHLLAELVDNATTFSPPESRVELKGNVVGKGVVLEVEDQGLGIEQQQRDEFNAMLANPPDFSVMTLSEEPRLGLFVVARLASRHGIRVTLRESAYGGTRAIVLIRTELIHSEPTEEEPAPAEEAPHSDSGDEEHRPPRAEAVLPQQNGAQQSQAPVSNGSQSDLPARRAPSRAVPIDATVPDMPTSRNGSSNGSPRGVPEDNRHRWPEAEQTRRHENGRQVRPPNERDEAAKPERNGHGPPPGSQPSAASRNAASQNRQQPRNGRPGQGASPNPAAGQEQNGLSAGRPALPQRRRQQHIAPQLRESGPAAETEQAQTPDQQDEGSADTAKHRLTAFQRGTKEARGQEEGS